MSDLEYRIELTQEHRDLILKYGYVSGRLETALRRWPQGQLIRRVGMTRVELQWLIADLTHSCVKGKAGRDIDAVNELCEHLDYAQQTGDGDLDIFE